MTFMIVSLEVIHLRGKFSQSRLGGYRMGWWMVSGRRNGREGNGIVAFHPPPPRRKIFGRGFISG